MKEPTVLLVGGRLEVIDILAKELEKRGKRIMIASDEAMIAEIVEHFKIDIVIIGTRITITTPEAIKVYTEAILPDVPIHIVEKTEQSSPLALYDEVQSIINQHKNNN